VKGMHQQCIVVAVASVAVAVAVAALELMCRHLLNQSDLCLRVQSHVD